MYDENIRSSVEERQVAILKLLETTEPGSQKHDALVEEYRILSEIIEKHERGEIDREKIDLEREKFNYQKVMDLVDERHRVGDIIVRISPALAEIGIAVLGGYLSSKNLKLAFGFETNGSFRSRAAMEAFRRATNPRLK